MKKLLPSLWFNWFALTLVYLVFLFSFVGGLEIGKLVTYTIGLFVPIGFFSLAASLGDTSLNHSYSYTRLLTLPLLFLVLYFGNRLTSKFSHSAKRIIANLIILLLLTLATDLILYQTWPSFGLFKEALLSVLK